MRNTRIQKSEFRIQKSESRSQKSEFRSRNGEGTSRARILNSRILNSEFLGGDSEFSAAILNSDFWILTSRGLCGR